MEKKEIAGVNKYEIHWQIVCASVKGKNTLLDDKLKKYTSIFFNRKRMKLMHARLIGLRDYYLDIRLLIMWKQWTRFKK